MINLDRQTERLRWMERGLDAAGVPFRRVRAVDARRLPVAFLAERLPASGRPLSPFEVALTLSHRKAWRAFLRSGAGRCVVCEDDVHFGRDFAALLSALDSGRIPFDIVKLETVGERVLIDAGACHMAAGRRLCPLRSAYMGAAGYVLNRHAAATLLRVSRSLSVPLDWVLFGESHLASNRLTVLQTVPGIVAQEEHLRRLAPMQELRSNQPTRITRTSSTRKLLREASRPFQQLGAVLARLRMRRAAPGLRWGRIGFE
jgi:glycosyl transferase family 25